MNKTFQKADQAGRLLLLKMLQEENKALSIYFKMEAHSFFKEHYKNMYESFFTSPNHDDIRLNVGIVGISDKKKTVSFKFTRHWSSDAERYNDSCYQVFTCPAYPDGLEFEIGIKLIESLVIYKRPLKGIN